MTRGPHRSRRSPPPPGRRVPSPRAMGRRCNGLGTMPHRHDDRRRPKGGGFPFREPKSSSNGSPSRTISSGPRRSCARIGCRATTTLRPLRGLRDVPPAAQGAAEGRGCSRLSKSARTSPSPSATGVARPRARSARGRGRRVLEFAWAEVEAPRVVAVVRRRPGCGVVGRRRDIAASVFGRRHRAETVVSATHRLRDGHPMFLRNIGVGRDRDGLEAGCVVPVGRRRPKGGGCPFREPKSSTNGSPSRTISSGPRSANAFPAAPKLAAACGERSNPRAKRSGEHIAPDFAARFAWHHFQ
jgi:hypothetical protein